MVNDTRQQARVSPTDLCESRSRLCRRLEVTLLPHLHLDEVPLPALPAHGHVDAGALAERVLGLARRTGGGVAGARVSGRAGRRVAGRGGTRTATARRAVPQQLDGVEELALGLRDPDLVVLGLGHLLDHVAGDDGLGVPLPLGLDLLDLALLQQLDLLLLPGPQLNPPGQQLIQTGGLGGPGEY